MKSEIVALNTDLKSGKVSAAELVQESIAKANKLQPELNMFVSTTYDKAEEMVKTIDASDLEKSLLAGIPTAIKDNYNWLGTVTTASSHMLENYVSPYSATVVERMLKNKTPIIGKLNMDAFAHGSSTATSDYGISKNPVNHDYYPGGSSGGSAAVVAAGVVPYAMGSETAGSIRQPASWTGLVGIAPTYGRLSRYGLVAMGSSLDRPGPLAHTVADCAIVIDALSGRDPRDATTADLPITELYRNLNSNIKGKKIGLPKQYWDDRINVEVRESVRLAVSELEKLGAEIVELDLLDPQYSIAVYTIVCRSEVSSNLARIDGVRYGHREVEAAGDFLEKISNNRGGGFGKEAKQRMLTGAYTLSAGYFDAYYKKAQQVRNLIKQDLEQAFTQVDVIISPTAPTTAMKIGDPMVNDPLFGELSDVLVEASALSGMPAMNIPVGTDSNKLPIGMQIIGKQWDEQSILNMALAYEQLVD